MLYPKKRPFFYTNFVSTLDGKIAVKSGGYWPIGSKKDHEMLVKLRSEADCLIHGKNLYKEFGDITRKSLGKTSFKELRKKHGKSPNLPYVVASRNLKKVVRWLTEKGYKRILVEGGPTLLGSFLKEGLMDEIYLTISPKIYGNETGKTLTLVEGILFKPNQVKLKLISVKEIGDEVFLRYAVPRLTSESKRKAP